MENDSAFNFNKSRCNGWSILKKTEIIDVVEANVTVTDIKIKEQQKKDEITVQDHVTDAVQTTGKFTSKQVDKVEDVAFEQGRVEDRKSVV